MISMKLFKLFNKINWFNKPIVLNKINLLNETIQDINSIKH